MFKGKVLVVGVIGCVLACLASLQVWMRSFRFLAPFISLVHRCSSVYLQPSVEEAVRVVCCPLSRAIPRRSIACKPLIGRLKTLRTILSLYCNLEFTRSSPGCSNVSHSIWNTCTCRFLSAQFWSDYLWCSVVFVLRLIVSHKAKDRSYAFDQRRSPRAILYFQMQLLRFHCSIPLTFTYPSVSRTTI